MRKKFGKWSIGSDDESVFFDSGQGQSVCCVDPLRAYLDLKHHAERGPEMAPLLKTQIDIARRLRAREDPEKILQDYKPAGIARAHLDFTREVVRSSADRTESMRDTEHRA